MQKIKNLIKDMKENKDFRNAIYLVMIVIIAGSLILFLIDGENSKKERIGKAICKSNNLSFWYVSGNTVRCYVLNETTGLKTEYKYWMDVELCEEIYLD